MMGLCMQPHPKRNFRSACWLWLLLNQSGLLKKCMKIDTRICKAICCFLLSYCFLRLHRGEQSEGPKCVLIYKVLMLQPSYFCCDFVSITCLPVPHLTLSGRMQMAFGKGASAVSWVYPTWIKINFLKRVSQPTGAALPANQPDSEKRVLGALGQVK